MIKNGLKLATRLGLRVPQRSFHRSSILTNNLKSTIEKQHEQYHRKMKNLKIERWVFSVVGISALGYGVWYFYWPHHTFPVSVAKILRKGLWAESNKESFNYQKAVEFYINALEECDKVHMNPISDEYTGIELKVAEMYEKLNMFEEANGIYLELLYRFYDALNSPGKVSVEQRPDMIRRDLRVLIKSLEINKDLNVGKRNLLAHLLLAQEEILSRSPELKEFFERRKEKAKNIFQGKALASTDFKTFIDEENIKLNDGGYMILDLQKNSSAWEPFKEEFFTARDLYTAYCLSAKDITAALSCKMTTVEWMVMADMPPGQILLSQANLGSLLYLQGEKFEADIYQLEQRCGEDPSLKKTDVIIKSLRHLHRNRDTCLDMSHQCYNSVVQFAKRNSKLRFNIKDQLDPSVLQAIALSTYGMGVLNLHQGVLVKAEKLLKDSISLARETDFTELLKEAENELQKTSILKTKKQAEQPQPN
ncbi:mitochondrial inner membrane i-AAA protease complex subunit [Zygosaccharomyces mellis]|uniref:Mitochondrial inner membrane i-AAA protease complex subunit n=1 Tax=Zygosaccharomyces mellis TaxID=42258 RepID=A0A4C2E324_9SACH|nr:mitochondrial inner membrane i-AAA protease complex subunit [Zygosaccharomyces mellis]